MSIAAARAVVVEHDALALQRERELARFDEIPAVALLGDLADHGERGLVQFVDEHQDGRRRDCGGVATGRGAIASIVGDELAGIFADRFFLAELFVQRDAVQNLRLRRKVLL